MSAEMSAEDQLRELDAVEERHARHKARRAGVQEARGDHQGPLTMAPPTDSAPRTQAEAEAANPETPLKSRADAEDFIRQQEAKAAKRTTDGAGDYYFVTRDSSGRTETSTGDGASEEPPATPPDPQEQQRFPHLDKHASWMQERATAGRATFSMPRKRSRAITALQSQLIQARNREKRKDKGKRKKGTPEDGSASFVHRRSLVFLSTSCPKPR